MKTSLLQIGFIIFILIPTISIAQQFLQKGSSQRVYHDEGDQTPPFIPKKITASGYLKQGTKSFNPEKISDGNLNTWWTPYPDQGGQNSWIDFSFSTPVTMNCLKMINGSNCDDPNIGNLFYLNNRLKSANLYFSDGSMVSINLYDDTVVQTIAFNSVRTSYVKMIVQEVYPGIKWNDLSIPEIHFFNLNGLDFNRYHYNSPTGGAVKEQSARISDKTNSIIGEDEALNIAYYVIGSSKELKNNGVLKSGEILADFNNAFFVKIDMRKVTEISLLSKRAKILSSHPSSAYKFTGNKNVIQSLQIIDYKSFWSNSKHLVLVTE